MRDKKPKRKNVKLKPKKEKISFTVFFKVLKLTFVTACIAATVGVTGYYGSQAFKQFVSKPIARVVVEGEFLYIAREDVVEMINGHMQGSFIRESLNKMQQQIQQNPWIDRVVLRRQWPDQLRVSIVEQKPIARWGDDGFVNFRGELIRVDDAKLIQNLPILHGAESSALTIMKQYQVLSQVISAYDIRIVELEENQLGVWTTHLDNGWKLLLGRTDVVKKFQRVMHMLAQNKIRRQDEISVIDMRYENGLAIQWKAVEQQHANRPLAVKPNNNEQNI